MTTVSAATLTVLTLVLLGSFALAGVGHFFRKCEHDPKFRRQWGIRHWPGQTKL